MSEQEDEQSDPPNPGWFDTSETEFSTIIKGVDSSTTQASNNVRTLALAAIGVIWIFNNKVPEVAGTYHLPTDLLCAAKWIVICLCLDLAQYLYRATAWKLAKFFATNINPSAQDSAKFNVWHNINFPSTVLFYSKAVVLGLGYYFVLKFLLETVQ